MTASDDRTARFWSVVSGDLIRTLAGHAGAVTGAEFSPDAKLIVTVSADGDGRLWNGRNGRQIRVLRGHFGIVRAASFSPNGHWIVTAGPFTVGLWDAGTGRLFAPTGSVDPYLRGPTRPVTSVQFGRDGKRILAASADGSVRTYLCDVCGGPADLRRLARVRLRQGAPVRR